VPSGDVAKPLFAENGKKAEAGEDVLVEEIKVANVRKSQAHTENDLDEGVVHNVVVLVENAIKLDVRKNQDPNSDLVRNQDKDGDLVRNQDKDGDLVLNQDKDPRLLREANNLDQGSGGALVCTPDYMMY